MSPQLWLLIEEECDYRDPLRLFETPEAAKRWCALNIEAFQRDTTTGAWRESVDVNGEVSYSWRYYSLVPVPFGEDA